MKSALDGSQKLQKSLIYYLEVGLDLARKPKPRRFCYIVAQAPFGRSVAPRHIIIGPLTGWGDDATGWRFDKTFQEQETAYCDFT